MSSPVTTQPSPPTPTTGVERPKKPLLSALLTRPEIGSLAAAIAIFIFFFALAEPFRTLPALSTVLYASSSIGIVAVGVALLMIGGEFDLSAGVSVVTGALTASMACAGGVEATSMRPSARSARNRIGRNLKSPR